MLKACIWLEINIHNNLLRVTRRLSIFVSFHLVSKLCPSGVCVARFIYIFGQAAGLCSLPDQLIALKGVDEQPRQRKVCRQTNISSCSPEWATLSEIRLFNASEVPMLFNAAKNGRIISLVVSQQIWKSGCFTVKRINRTSTSFIHINVRIVYISIYNIQK